VMYVICRYLGRGWLLRLGSWLGITESKLLSMDRWVAQTGSGAVFMARLLPVVRHLIGIPMGLARMSYWRYSVMTLLGSGLWCAVLAWVGVAAGHDPQLLAGDVQRLSLWFGVGALLLFGVYVWLVRRHFKA
jgi:membrane protein DedA with SNARE-associated domain